LNNFGVIYKATNRINGKCYIGQTTQGIDRRILEHSYKNSGCRYFKNAINKYGKVNFDWEILCDCDSEFEINDKECFYINKYKTFDKEFGYNLNKGGVGNRGFRHSLETKNKISKSKTGVKLLRLTKEHKIKIGLANKGHTHSEESKNRMSTARVGKYRGKDSWMAKKYIITFPDNEECLVHSLRNFCSFLNKKQNIVSYKGMSAVATGRRNHHKGFKCRYFDENKDSGIKFWKSEEIRGRPRIIQHDP